MYFRVVIGLILSFFLLSHPAQAVSEGELKDRWADIESYFESHVKTGEFKGAGGASLAYAYVDGDTRLPPVVVSVGLGESFIHYKELIYDLMAMGEFHQAFYVFDLRSQGFSQKLAPDPNLIYVESFNDYVTDLELFLDKVVRPKYPRPARFMAHSTGGLIAFHLLSRRPELAENVIFVAPLFGLNYGGTPTWLMELVTKTLVLFGFKNKDIPFRSGSSIGDFASNRMTHSEPRFEILKNSGELLPTKELGRPSVGFVVASQVALQRSFLLATEFTVPSVVLSADEDIYVSTPESERYCRAMPSCTHLSMKGARHVLMIERDPVRDQVIEHLKAALVVSQEGAQ